MKGNGWAGSNVSGVRAGRVDRSKCSRTRTRSPGDSASNSTFDARAVWPLAHQVADERERFVRGRIDPVDERL